MRTLLMHCKNYSIKIGKLADRPKDIRPEKVSDKEQNYKNCVVALITIEKGDDIKSENCKQLVEEIKKLSKETKHYNVVLLPFAHLSNNLASTEKSLKIFKTITELLSSDKKYKAFRSHFGSHKELLLDTYGHPGNVRFREFK